MKIIPFFLLTVLLCSSCSTADPVIVEVSNGAEHSMSCEKLSSEIASAEKYRNAAREDDKFMFRYINPFTGVYSAYKINKAEGNASERLKLLNSVYKEKNCSK